MLTAADLTTDAGIAWDAVRIPLAPGLELHRSLCRGQDTYGRLGPIVASERSQATYWLITTGSTQDAWPDGCRLLTVGSTIALPCARLPATFSRWLHRPEDPDYLTGAVWLAAALTHPTLEALR